MLKHSSSQVEAEIQTQQIRFLDWMYTPGIFEIDLLLKLARIRAK